MPTRVRKAFVMSVHPDRVAEYTQRHNPIWPDLAEILTQHGVHNYSIFLHPETHQLFAYVEIESEERWAQIAATEVCQRWWAHMKDHMPTDVQNRPVALDLAELFHLD